MKWGSRFYAWAFSRVEPAPLTVPVGWGQPNLDVDNDLLGCLNSFREYRRAVIEAFDFQSDVAEMDQGFARFRDQVSAVIRGPLGATEASAMFVGVTLTIQRVREESPTGDIPWPILSWASSMAEALSPYIVGDGL